MPTQPNLIRTGIPYIYKAVYPSGYTKYLLKYSRAGFSRKVSFPFTPQGLKDAENALPKVEEAFRKFAKEKGVVDPSIKKLTNPADPKKPWRYQRPNKPIEYFATEAQAEAFRNKAVSAKFEAQTKLPKADFPKIKKRIMAGATLEDIATTYKLKNVGNIRTLLAQNNTTYSDLSPHDSYLKDAKSLKYIKDNYGKLKGETMAKKLYPTLAPTTALSRVSRLVSKLLTEKKIKEVPAALIEEVRIEQGYNPEESAKKASKARKAKIKKFSVPAFERAMKGTKASQLSHMDDLATQVVRFENIGYSPQKINAEILKNVDPYFTSLYEKRAKLLKNKPKGWVKQVIEINERGEDVARATRGYKGFNVIEPGGKSYTLALDAAKSVDPFGQFEGKTIQGVSPKKILKTSKTMEQIIPDAGERFLFLENAKRVREAQSRVPKGEINKIIKNLTELGFDTDPYKKRFVEAAKTNAGGVCNIFRAEGGRIGFAAGSSCARQMEAAFDADPVRTTQHINKIKTVTGRVKDASVNFLKLLGRGGARAAPLAALAAVGAGIDPLVKQFVADDPTTYLTDESQMKGMLLATIEGETPKVDEEILKWQLPALGAATATGAIPGARETYLDRLTGRGPAVGPAGTKALATIPEKPVGKVRAALGIKGVLGKALGATFSPLAVAATLPMDITAQRKGGTEWGDIATDPFNWMAPAFASAGAEMATKGMKPTGILAKAIRMGISPRTLSLVSRRFGMPGLAVSAGMWGYDKWKNRSINDED